MQADAFDKLPERALTWAREGRQVALATVVATWGSAPRPTGSQMMIAADGAIEGSVSGGCVEGAVVVAAQEAMKTGQPRLLVFGVTEDDAFSAGLACGGEIKVLVEPIGDADGGDADAKAMGQGMPLALLADLVAARHDRRPVAYQVDTANWTRHLTDVPEGGATGMREQVFTHLHPPPLRLVIVGAVHVAQALIPMAQMVGYDVTLIDPRGAFATAERFPTATVYEEYPDDVLPQLTPDARTAIVTLAHDPKIDDPALEAGLRSDVFYIGCLGSRRTQQARRDRLAARGFDAEALARLHGPVGLNIGSVGPAEIAVSIMAELVAVQRGIPCGQGMEG